MSMTQIVQKDIRDELTRLCIALHLNMTKVCSCYDSKRGAGSGGTIETITDIELERQNGIVYTNLDIATEALSLEWHICLRKDESVLLMVLSAFRGEE